MQSRTLKTPLASTGLCAAALAASPQTAPIRPGTKDKPVSIAGKLVESDGSTCIIRAAIGTVSISNEFATCVGFTDPVGCAILNQFLSQQRAERSVVADDRTQ